MEYFEKLKQVLDNGYIDRAIKLGELIKRHAVTNMDQFANWKIKTILGDIFITIPTAPLVSDEAYM